MFDINCVKLAVKLFLKLDFTYFQLAPYGSTLNNNSK